MVAENEKVTASVLTLEIPATTAVELSDTEHDGAFVKAVPKVKVHAVVTPDPTAIVPAVSVLPVPRLGLVPQLDTAGGEPPRMK